MSYESLLEVNTEAGHRAVMYDAVMEDQFPNLPASFEVIDETYRRDKLAAFQRLAEHQFPIYPVPNGAPVEASVIFDAESAKSTEVMLIFGPFSDVGPRSDPEEIFAFINTLNPGRKDKSQGQPHSYSQSNKSDDIHALLKAEGRAMPVITIFNPIPLPAYSAKNIKKINRGDFAGSSQIAELAIGYVQSLLHGQAGETRLEGVHYNGASLGATNALASAVELIKQGRFGAKSVTAQELILGPTGIVDLAKRYASSTIGEESKESLYPDAVVIPESAMRRDVDGRGNEVSAQLQLAGGLIKKPYMKGLTNPRFTIEDVEFLSREGVATTIAVAHNSAPAQDTVSHLHHIGDNKHIVRIRGVKGTRAGHEVNEVVRATSTIALMGVSKSRVSR